MIFGGIQKNSLIDYPGKISCVLFLTGCNFDCPYCHNPELVKVHSPCKACLTERNVYEFLNQRKNFLEAVVISGGEPTLQKDLMELCQRIKDLKYPVKLDTNGSQPAVIQELIRNRLVDYIAMDVKTDPFQYDPLIQKNCDPSAILSSIHIIMESGLPYEFKTTCLKPLINEDVFQRICRIIQGARLYALQKFRPTEVLHPEFFQENHREFDDDALLHLKSIADSWVKKCIIR